MNNALTDLLDQYAREAGYADMTDLKSQYHPRAYAVLLPQFVRRAQCQLAVTQ